MRQVATEHVVAGMRTAQGISKPGDMSKLPLVAAGVSITESIKARLLRSGVERIYIDDDLSAGIEPVRAISDSTRTAAVSIVREAFTVMRSEDSQFTHDNMKHVDAAISTVIAELTGRKGLLICLSDLHVFGGDRIHDAINACVLGIAIGDRYFAEHGWRDFRGKRRDDRIPDRLAKLGVGLLFADIGLLSLPEELRSGMVMASAQARVMMKQHPVLGVEILEASEVSPLVKVVIAQHHERWDGSGYPKRLAGEDVHELGQIAGIADAWVGLTSRAQSAGKPISPHKAWELLTQSSERLFSEKIVTAFQLVVTPYGAGTIVQLSDGRVGIVRRSDPAAPHQPLVRVTHDKAGDMTHEPDDLDLSLRRELRITGVLDGFPTDTCTVMPALEIR